MSDETDNHSSGSDNFLNSSKSADNAVLVVNDQGKVLFSNPLCQSNFGIFQEQSVVFDLEAGGIRVANETSADDAQGQLIPYSTINEVEYFGAHCFSLVLDTSHLEHRGTELSCIQRNEQLLLSDP